MRNYPIDEFDFKQYTNTDNHGDPKYPTLNKSTLGFRFIHEEPTATKSSSANLLSFFMEFVTLYLQAETLISQHMNKEYHRSIVLNTSPINTLTFKQLTSDEMQFLEQQANKAVNDYFKIDIVLNSANVLTLPSIYPSIRRGAI